jgi:cobalt-zinc-cadmium efflux system protein
MSATDDHRGRGTAHAGHSHGVNKDADRRLLSIALSLIVGFMVVEIVVGLLASSLALIADAGHMLTDAAAIGLALVAMRLAARPAKGAFTYGLRRAEILSAQANGLTLLLLSVVFTVEGIRRLVDPPSVHAGLVLATALFGIVVNLAAAYVLSKANRQSMNVEGSFQHIVTDLYAFIGTALSAGVILTTGWDRADPIATLLVAALMLKAGLGLVRESARVFLEAAPRGIDPVAVEAAILASPGVVGVHELHVWEVTSGFPALSAHVLVDAVCDCHGSRQDLEAMLDRTFGIDHTTLQVDHRDDHDPAPAGAAVLEYAPATTAAEAHANERRWHTGHAGELHSTGDHDHPAGC